MAHVVVRIENTYVCGRQSVAEVEVPAPESVGLEHEVWWDVVVHQYTGDGHDGGSSEDALYEATIVGPEGRYDVGTSCTWEG